MVNAVKTDLYLLNKYNASACTKVKVIWQGQGRITRLHFSKNGRFRGISVSQTQLVFSSPEHEVLRVSYCDSAVSVVHRQLVGLCML